MAAFADAGLPMIFVELPFLVVALVPVVLLEALVFRFGLPVSFPRALGGSLVGNLCSTFLGVPMTWLALVFAQLCVGGGGVWGLQTPLRRVAAVTVQAPWLIPYEGEFYWMVPAASLFLMLPFFLVSVVTERNVLSQCWPAVDGRRLTRSVWLANLLSYGALAAYWASQLALAEPKSIA